VPLPAEEMKNTNAMHCFPYIDFIACFSPSSLHGRLTTAVSSESHQHQGEVTRVVAL